jgi:hypothetical protein
VPEKVKKDTHVTPRVYLRRFATDGLLIAQRTGCEPKPIGVPEVAVRMRLQEAVARLTGMAESAFALSRLEVDE